MVGKVTVYVPQTKTQVEDMQANARNPSVRKLTPRRGCLSRVPGVTKNDRTRAHDGSAPLQWSFTAFGKMKYMCTEKETGEGHDFLAEDEGGTQDACFGGD